MYQSPHKSEFKYPNPTGLVFDNYKLDFLWDLDFGSWDLPEGLSHSESGNILAYSRVTAF